MLPATLGTVDGVEYAVTGQTANSQDFNEAQTSSMPMVFGFVLLFAFGLLLVSFRSIVIAVKAIVLNLLSVAAAYGVLVAIFQWGWGESLLDFQSNGGIANWLPMFMFVILFGLSMDYHVFILSRIREAYDRGLSTDDAISYGIKSTAGVVTSAAVVMVGVFLVFTMLPLVDLKEMGIGLAVAVLIDATIVRAVLLPASMKLLGERNWYLPTLARVAAEPRARALGRAGRPGHGQARVSSRPPDRRPLSPGAPPADRSLRQAARTDIALGGSHGHQPPLISTSASQLEPSRGCDSDVRVARLAIGVVALHVVDDNFLQPNPGTSAADHLVGGLVPLALLVAAGVVLPAAPRRGTRDRSRSSPASSASSPARRPSTTRERSARRATTTPGCCRSSPGSCCSASAP